MMCRWLILLFVPALAAAQPAEPAPDPAPVEETPARPEPAPVLAPRPPPAQQAGRFDDHTSDAGDFNPTLTDLDSARPSLFVDPANHLFQADLELFGTGAYTTRSGSSLSEFRLDRGELGATIRPNEYVGAELRLESIRSAADGGSLGIQGDSLVMRVKRAQVFGDYVFDTSPEGLHVHGALGITPDPWITALETEYPLRPLSATASERGLGWPTSDLSALARIEYRFVRASVSIGNGEGLDYPERNNGKTTTGVIEAVPFDLRDPRSGRPIARLRLAGVARDGSVGPARVRERRFGGAATLWTPIVSAGGEVVQGSGIGDRGDLEALALAGWAEVRPLPKLALVGRLTTLGFSDGGGRASSFGGAVAVEPWRGTIIPHDHERMCRVGHGSERRCPYRSTVGTFRLWLAIDHTTTSGTAMPLPGADPGTATSFLLIASTVAPFTVD